MLMTVPTQFIDGKNPFKMRATSLYCMRRFIVLFQEDKLKQPSFILVYKLYGVYKVWEAMKNES